MKFNNKIFSITKKGKHDILTILGIKIRYTKNDLNWNSWNGKYLRYKFFKIFNFTNYDYATIDYVLRYKYAIDLAHKELENIPQEEKNQQTNKIWAMWMQEENIPESIQMCLDTIKHFHPEVTIITENNIHEYVNIPNYISEKYKKGIIQSPHFSDYIRMYLLDKYGGTWIDASTLMLDKIPEFILQQPFFVFRTLDKTRLSNFFIHSEKNNLITKTIRIFLEEYWKHENITINYLFFHYFFNYICTHLPEYKKLYNKIISYPNSTILYFSEYAADNSDEKAWEYLSKNSFMYKTTRKNKSAVKNPNSWYNFLLKEYRNGKLLSNMDSTAV